MNPSNPTDATTERERLERTRREIQRLDRLRQNVANGLLEVSEAAKRDAHRLLSEVPQGAVSGAADQAPAPVHFDRDTPTATASRPVPAHTGWSSPFLYGAFAVGLLSGLLLAIVLRGPATDPPTVEVSEVGQPGSEGADVPLVPQAAESPPSPTREPPLSTVTSGSLSGFVLTLTPSRTCWLRSSVDGGEPLERLLPPGRTIVLEVEEEARLRIGDAAAMTMLINDQPTRPLGGEGQAVTLRITSANLESFLLASRR